MGSLIDMAAGVVEDGVSGLLFKEIAIVLIKIYETLRQCDPGGYIAQHLGHRYEKEVKKQLKTDWKEQLQRLKNEVACHVMGIVLYDRFKQWGLKQVMHDQGQLVKRASMENMKRKSLGGS